MSSSPRDNEPPSPGSQPKAGAATETPGSHPEPPGSDSESPGSHPEPPGSDSESPDSDPEPPRTLHDALFKDVFGDPAHAAAALRAVLPPSVAAHIDWDSLTPVHASVVSIYLNQRHGDLLYQARLKHGGEAYLWLLYEHQSTIDHWMVWRVARMTLDFLDRWRTRHREATRLPAVLPVVFYHGVKPWDAPASLLELYDLSPQERTDLADY